jgi:hypothetical protein
LPPESLSAKEEVKHPHKGTDMQTNGRSHTDTPPGIRERLEYSKSHERDLTPSNPSLTDSDFSDSSVPSLIPSDAPSEYFAEVLRMAENTPLPPAAEDIIHPSIRHLLRICIVFANNVMRMQGPGQPFYLSSYVAARMLKTSQPRAYKFLMMLCKAGFIEKTKRGGKKTANRYRLIR